MKKTEKRAYVIHVDDIPKGRDNGQGMTDKEYIEHGNEYTLPELQAAINTDEISFINSYIRFIEAETSEEETDAVEKAQQAKLHFLLATAQQALQESTPHKGHEKNHKGTIENIENHLKNK